MEVSARSAPTGLVTGSLRRHSLSTCIICLLVSPQGQLWTVQLVPLGKGMGRNFSWVCDIIIQQVSICICLNTASACLQLPLFIPFTLRDVTWLVSQQQKVPEILATFSPSVRVDGIWRQLDLALWLGSFLELGKRQPAYTASQEGEEGVSVTTAFFSPNLCP